VSRLSKWGPFNQEPTEKGVSQRTNSHWRRWARP